MGPNGFLQVEKTRPWLFIDSSTIDPQTSRKISANLLTHVLKSPHRMSHPTMLDAPVSGGVPGAEAATLTFMVQFNSIPDFHCSYILAALILVPSHA